MQINSINSPNFKARHIDIRKADDIARHVNRCFPMFKPTYALQNWKTLDANKANGSQLRKSFFRKYMYRVMDMRDEYMGTSSKNYSYHIDLMNCVDKKKFGNCHESAYITLGTLYANGFNKSKKVSPRIEIMGFNKKTHEVAVQKSFPIDHTCVLTSMNNPKREAVENAIVIDSWLNKAMTVDEAKKEYFKLLPKKELASDLSKTQEELRRKLSYKMQDRKLEVNDDFDINDYDFKYGIHFVSNTDFTQSEIEQFSKDVQENYPRLLLNQLA